MNVLSSGELASMLTAYGYWVVFALVAIESMGAPVPGETALLVASVYAGATGHLSLALVIAAAAAGAVVGDNLGYVLGRTGGDRLLRRYGRYVRLDESRLRLGRYLFARHGGKVVFYGRFVAFLRMWAAFLAGANRMPWRRFLAFNAVGGVTWAALMASIAYVYGDNVLRMGGMIAIASAAIGVVGMGALLLVVRRNEQRLQDEADWWSGVTDEQAA